MLQEQRRKIQQKLLDLLRKGGITQKQYDCLLLRFLPEKGEEFLQYKTIEEHLGISKSSIREHINQAMFKIKKESELYADFQHYLIHLPRMSAYFTLREWIEYPLLDTLQEEEKQQISQMNFETCQSALFSNATTYVEKGIFNENETHFFLLRFCSTSKEKPFPYYQKIADQYGEQSQKIMEHIHRFAEKIPYSERLSELLKHYILVCPLDQQKRALVETFGYPEQTFLFPDISLLDQEQKRLLILQALHDFFLRGYATKQAVLITQLRFFSQETLLSSKDIIKQLHCTLSAISYDLSAIAHILHRSSGEATKKLIQEYARQLPLENPKRNELFFWIIGKNAPLR